MVHSNWQVTSHNSMNFIKLSLAVSQSWSLWSVRVVFIYKHVVKIDSFSNLSFSCFTKNTYTSWFLVTLSNFLISYSKTTEQQDDINKFSYINTWGKKPVWSNQRGTSCDMLRLTSKYCHDLLHSMILLIFLYKKHDIISVQFDVLARVTVTNDAKRPLCKSCWV